ncbi:tat pathway signal sequence [Talaromyces proteolyticus]|uniref:Tat pathway signal sequence n=1 Tax=Talaromyces proteolyticus TaxID=1131652 RepID=A0AAD4PXG5_9EURO|nr:tat pathway signal sequence [Talaromyces proteolyticus]KAH8699312.1 tat pathway signal sequence [Talaromyces proteolyticus]
MYSARPLMKDHDPTDSTDTESLLTVEQSQEKLLHSVPSNTSKRNKVLKTYLHIAAIVFYSVITVILYTWSTRINEKQCGCDNAAIYSPARTAIEYEKQTIVHNLADNGKYRGPPRPEQDAAWEDLLRYNNLRIQKEDLEKANTTSVPLNDDQGGYLATLDVFHTLHCVNKIRKSYYSDYYHDPNPLVDQQEHFDHCIDLLRQVIMCHGDISLHTYEWKDDYRWPWPSMRTEHQCRNWDKLMVWSKEHYLPSLTGPILSHPSLGISFRGDEPHS